MQSSSFSIASSRLALAISLIPKPLFSTSLASHHHPNVINNDLKALATQAQHSALAPKGIQRIPTTSINTRYHFISIAICSKMCHLSIFWHSCDHLVPMTLACPFHKLPYHPQDPTSTALLGHPCPLCDHQHQQHQFQSHILLTAKSLSTILNTEPSQPGFLNMIARFYARGDHKRFTGPSPPTMEAQYPKLQNVLTADSALWDIPLAGLENPDPIRGWKPTAPEPDVNSTIGMDSTIDVPPTANFYFYAPAPESKPRSGSGLGLGLGLGFGPQPGLNWETEMRMLELQLQSEALNSLPANLDLDLDGSPNTDSNTITNSDPNSNLDQVLNHALNLNSIWTPTLTPTPTSTLTWPGPWIYDGDTFADATTDDLSSSPTPAMVLSQPPTRSPTPHIPISMTMPSTPGQGRNRDLKRVSPHVEPTHAALHLPPATMMRQIRYRRNGKQRQEMVRIGKSLVGQEGRREKREKREQ